MDSAAQSPWLKTIQKNAIQTPEKNAIVTPTEPVVDCVRRNASIHSLRLRFVPARNVSVRVAVCTCQLVLNGLRDMRVATSKH